MAVGNESTRKDESVLHLQKKKKKSVRIHEKNKNIVTNIK